MLTGADIELLRWENPLPEILECARMPKRMLSGKRNPRLAVSVTNYCEKQYLCGRVSFFPFMMCARIFRF